jgi:hypothetical protein
LRPPPQDEYTSYHLDDSPASHLPPDQGLPENDYDPSEYDDESCVTIISNPSNEPLQTCYPQHFHHMIVMNPTELNASTKKYCGIYVQ